MEHRICPWDPEGPCEVLWCLWPLDVILFCWYYIHAEWCSGVCISSLMSACLFQEFQNLLLRWAFLLPLWRSLQISLLPCLPWTRTGLSSIKAMRFGLWCSRCPLPVSLVYVVLSAFLYGKIKLKPDSHHAILATIWSSETNFENPKRFL